MTDFNADLAGRTAIDSDGAKIDTIGQTYLDDQTNEPNFITAHRTLRHHGELRPPGQFQPGCREPQVGRH